MANIVDALADFSANTQFEQLPANVVQESKRLLIDSIGCALGGLSHPKGTIGVQYARLMGAGAAGAQASILGTGEKVSTVAAGFANGELMNALDFDSILPPGHVSPYVLPGALAVAEAAGASGKELLVATAVSHEMSNRLGKSMDYLRDIKDGKVSPPPVYGYASTVFGATAAIGRLKGHSRETIAHGLGIAGCTVPVNSHWAWSQHAPATTIKYTAAGPMVQAAMAAAHLAEFGHRGDRMILDDAEFGFRKIIGSTRWEPQHITDGLGSSWGFPAEQSYKPYPHCRILHALLDCLYQITEANDIKPGEIESITAWVEGFVMQPLWLLRQIEHVTDAQFSVVHGLSVGAHRVPPGKQWQSPDVVFDPSVLALMDKIHFEVHPDYEKLLSGHAASRPARIEVRARGQSWVGEKRYPHGSPSPDPSTTMSDSELVAKFVRNAEGVLSPRAADEAIMQLLNLEQVSDVASVIKLLSP
ncbi:MmgE/PrpD family protein [Variovorax defluvii]|uniref:MmgE/PrpD family protein n=1 Tax=Variovorax defluvii TaxID=913761 RepID=A0ABP8I8P7_9BURK